MLKRFKCHGANMAIGTMAARTVVVNCNIFEHALAYLFTSGKALTVDGFHLQAVEEAFRAGIAAAIALAAHAADNLLFCHKILIRVRTALAAAI